MKESEESSSGSKLDAGGSFQVALSRAFRRLLLLATRRCVLMPSSVMMWQVSFVDPGKALRPGQQAKFVTQVSFLSSLQIVTRHQIKRVLGPLLAKSPEGPVTVLHREFHGGSFLLLVAAGTYRVLAVDLPIPLVRAVTQAYYTVGGTQLTAEKTRKRRSIGLPRCVAAAAKGRLEVDSARRARLDVAVGVVGGRGHHPCRSLAQVHTSTHEPWQHEKHLVSSGLLVQAARLAGCVEQGNQCECAADVRQAAIPLPLFHPGSQA